ncbi:MAG: YbaK/EbsC family protein [Clostridia bacterium]|nr:YbaK/EbsC family protein [Clostridia bacterium]
MSLLKAKEHLKKYGFEDKVMEFSVSSATVSEAASAIGCSENEIAKTLSFIVDDNPILIVASGNARIDNKKFKEEFLQKAKMIPFEDVERYIGHSVGGVCPFGINEGAEVYLDNSLKNFDTVYPACGSSNSAVKLTLNELETASGYKKWIDVCKDVNENGQ